MNYVNSTQTMPTTLSPVKVNGIVWQMALVIAAIMLPSIAHLTGLSVRTLLPMHWPVILAGLVYGWRGGLMVGLVSPGLSFLTSGMPYPPMIAPMTVELAAYGLVAGWCREQLKWNAFLSTALALVVGRIIFLAFVVIAGSVSQAFGSYVTAAMLPGVFAALAQIATLPLLAGWWVSRSRK